MPGGVPPAAPSQATTSEPTPLRNRSFALLLSGGFVSDLGDWMLLIALPVYVFQLTGSALTTSTVFVAELIPGLIAGQFAGVLVDKVDRRRILVAASLAQAILLLPILLVHGADQLWIVYLVAAAQSCLARVCSPAKAALIPSLVTRSQLAPANSLSAVSDNLARLVGSPLGGLAIQVFGLVGVVVVDAITFLASAVLIAFVKVPPGTRVRDEGPRRGLVQDWLDGFRTIRRTPPLPAILSIGALGQLAQGIFVVLFVVFVLETLGGTGSDVGLIRGTQAIGGVLGGLVVGRLARRFGPERLVQWGYVAFGLIALATWNVAAVTSAIWVYVGLFIAAGIPGVALGAGLTTIVQSVAPPTHLGRIFAAFETFSGAVQAVGVLAAGALADRLGVIPILDLQASIYILCGMLLFIALRRRVAPG
ncbi:MAG: MFS transporter [Candidatus Limnocylindrales bacterium]